MRKLFIFLVLIYIFHHLVLFVVKVRKTELLSVVICCKNRDWLKLHSFCSEIMKVLHILASKNNKTLKSLFNW